MLTGRIDLSSNELHVTNECPFCHHEWVDKVKAKGRCPGCNRPYTMEKVEGFGISVGWTLTAEEAKPFKSDGL